MRKNNYLNLAEIVGNLGCIILFRSVGYWLPGFILIGILVGFIVGKEMRMRLLAWRNISIFLFLLYLIFFGLSVVISGYLVNALLLDAGLLLLLGLSIMFGGQFSSFRKDT